MPPTHVTIYKAHITSGTLLVTSQMAGSIIVSSILPLAAASYYLGEVAVGILIRRESRVAESDVNYELGLGGTFHVRCPDPLFIPIALDFRLHAHALRVKRIQEPEIACNAVAGPRSIRMVVVPTALAAPLVRQIGRAVENILDGCVLVTLCRLQAYISH